MTKVLDFIGDSISELFDVIFYTVFLSYLYKFIVRTDYPIQIIMSLVIPLFVVYAPYIYRMQKRHVVELIIKTIVYLLIGIITFIVSVTIFGGIFVTNKVTFFGVVFYIIFAIAIVRWIVRTLQKYQKEYEFIPYSERKTSKTKVLSLVLALGSWTITFSTYSSINEPDPLHSADYSDLILYPFAVFATFTSIVLTLFFILSLFERRR